MGLLAVIPYWGYGVILVAGLALAIYMFFSK
jgi:hypothetical protein